MAEQHRVFAPHRRRRIVLATNVAETSLTVPGIRSVIDPGTARISRYSTRLKVQRLPIEPISKASADQRAGRCGRVADGSASGSTPRRTSRLAPTSPIPRSPHAIWLGHPGHGRHRPGRHRHLPVRGPTRLAGRGRRGEAPARARGPGVERPRWSAAAGVGARPPVDPDGPAPGPAAHRSRFARMVLEADRHGCLREVLIIASGLSIQDPAGAPERPGRAAADQFHARFADDSSDFLAFVNLWTYVRERQRELSRCVPAPVSSRAPERPAHPGVAGRARPAPAGGQRPRPVHQPPSCRARPGPPGAHGRAPRDLGQKIPDSREFLGARGAASPSSPVPAWPAAARMGHGRRAGGDVTAVGPDGGPHPAAEWAEHLAGHLVKRSYSEPHWSTKRAAAMVHEKVTLYGLPIVADRLVGYRRVDPDHARELFIRHALVEGEWHSPHAFIARNRARLRRAGGARAPVPSPAPGGRSRHPRPALRRAGATSRW